MNEAAAGGMEERGLLAGIRQNRPLIHCITNYVTANDVANVLLAAGASPVMADGVREAAEIAAASQALVLNLGTLREPAIEAMLAAGKTAASKGIPIVLDPVGTGSASFRRETALRLLKELPVTLIRGNASEIRALATGERHGKGVDAGESEGWSEQPDSLSGQPETREGESDGRSGDQKTVTGEGTNLPTLAKDFAAETGGIVVVSGQRDLVTDGKQVCFVANGHDWMSRITGSGCMLDGLLAAFLTQAGQGEETDRFAAAAYALAAFGICGELAYESTAQTGGGTGSFRMYLIDAASLLTDEIIKRRAKIEI